MASEVLRSVWRSLASEGPCVTARLCLSRVADLEFDWRHGTDTFDWLEPARFGLPPEQLADVEYYKPTNAAALRKLLSRLDLRGERILLDVGCGKGRVMMVAAELGFDVARGVEFSPRLAAVTTGNLNIYMRLRQPQTRFEVECADIRNHRLRDDETLIYLFNPFGRETTARVVDLIEASLRRRPRRLHFIYRAPEHRSLIDASPFFRPSESYRFDGQKFLVYLSADTATPRDA